jgi:hypothetical protein
MNNIFDQFKEQSIQRGRTLYFSPLKAMEILRHLEREQIKVLGLDAVRISNNETQPFLEHSIDLSNREDCHKTAIRFIEEKIGLELFFEIVIDE